MIPEGQYIDVQDDFRFHYYDEGEGEAVVLLHGSGTGASGAINRIERRKRKKKRKNGR